MVSEAISGPAKLGQIWFHWRGLSPVPLFIILLVVPPSFVLSPVGVGWVVAGIALAESLRVWAVGYAGSATRTRGDTVPQLVHAGPFQYVRNPLYIANIAMYTLTGILFGSFWMAGFIFIYSAVQYHFIVAFEEKVLSESFGPSYALFRDRVPRWFPRWTPGMTASRHSFSLSTALSSERSTFVAFAALFAIWALRRTFIG